MSKKNDMYVVKSNEGYWVPLIMYHYAKSKKELFEQCFTSERQFYITNRKGLNNTEKGNYINMWNLSRLFDVLDQGFEYRITKEDFGEEYKQIAIDLMEFLNKYNRDAKLENNLDYCEIYI
jgi:hypothetical protein